MGRSLQRPGTTRTVVVGTGVMLLLGRRTKGYSRVINNVGTDTVYLGFDRSVLTGGGFQLLPGQTFNTDMGVEIWATGTSATSAVSILEEG